MNGITSFVASTGPGDIDGTHRPSQDAPGELDDRHGEWAMIAPPGNHASHDEFGHAPATKPGPMEAAGAVDAKTAPTAPCKTRRRVSHRYHRPSSGEVTQLSVTYVPG